MINHLRLVAIIFISALVMPGAVSAGWQSIGPDGGLVSDLWIDPANTNELLAPSYTNGLFKSSDGGQSFGPLPGSPLGESVSPAFFVRIERIIADPTNANRLFISSGNSGVYRSDDRGNSWQAINTGLDDGSIPRISDLSMSVDGAVLYAATSEGLYLSFDAATWTHVVIPGLTRINQVVASLNNPNRVYLTTRSMSIWRSDDAGASWVPASAGLGNQWVESFHADPDAGERLFQSSDHGQIDASDDLGVSWFPLVTGLTDATGRSVRLDGLVAQAGSDRVFALAQGRLYRSDDNGANWTAYDMAFDIDGGDRIILDPVNPDRVYLAARTGLFVSNDAGQSWTARHQGIRAHNMYDIQTSPLDGLTWFATGSRQFRSNNQGLSWTDISVKTAGFDEAQPLGISHTDPGRYYLPTWEIPPYRSDDGGQTWNPLASLPAAINASTRAWVDPTNDQVVVMANYGFVSILPWAGLYRSTDGGLNWVHSFPAPLDRTDFQPYSVAGDPGAPGTVYFGIHSSTEPTFTDGLVLKSSDHGASFDIVLDGMSFTQVVVDSAGIVYAGGWTQSKKQGVWRSPDGGVTWEQVSNGLPLPFSTVDLAAHPSQRGHVFVADSSNIYESKNEGQSWHLLESLGNNEPLSSIAITDDPDGDFMVIAGTQGDIYLGRNLVLRFDPQAIPALGRPTAAILVLLMLLSAGLLWRRTAV